MAFLELLPSASKQNRPLQSCCNNTAFQEHGVSDENEA
jgi:hypothetical protein